MYKKNKSFQFKPRSPFAMLLRIAKFELEGVDDFIKLTKDAHKSKKESLEQLADEVSGTFPDDWFADDVIKLDEFATLSAEFSIIGLWRCIEKYKARSKKAFRNTKSKTSDSTNWDNIVKNISCTKSVDELRCLNNAIKHSQKVDCELSKIWRWKNRKGNKLIDLDLHYERLRPFAEKYLEDLERRLNKWWEKTNVKNT